MKKKQMGRRFLASVFLLSSAFVLVHAEQLIVEEKSGGATSYDLGDSPMITYENNALVVKTDNASAEFQLANVAKYYFETVTTGSHELLLGSSALVSVTETGLRMENFASQTLVQVFSVNGMSIGEYRTSEEGFLDIDMSNMQSGVYVVKTSLSTIKIVKK